MFKSKSLTSLIIVSLLTISSSAMAAFDTVELNGTVLSTLAVEATRTTGANSAAALDLSFGEHIVKVADLEMSTNNEQGFSVTTSDGELTATGATSIAYVTHTVTNAAAAPANTVFGNANPNRASAGTLATDLYIMYSPAELQDPGDYVGEITVTITDL